MTFVLKTSAQSDGDSADQRLECSSEADSDEGSPLGPRMPALLTSEMIQRFWGFGKGGGCRY